MMMRRFSKLHIAMGLLSFGALVMAGCAAQKGPLSPNTNGLNTSSVGKGYPQVSSFVPGGGVLAVDQAVNVAFNMNMNPASFNLSSVLVYKQDVSGLSETLYPYYVMQYQPTLRTLLIKPDPAHNSGFWEDNARYRVALSPGITNVNGSQLDGNGNGIAEAAPFDTYHAYFSTGTPAAPGYANIPNGGGNGGGPLQSLKLISVTGKYYTTDGNGNTTPASISLLVANVGQVAAALPVTITAVFSQRLDLATAWVDATHLANAFSITDANGQVVAPTSVTLTSSSANPVDGNKEIQAVFMSGLAANGRYRVSIKGGLNGLRSSNEANQTLMRYLYFSGHGNSYASASDDTPVVTIVTTSGAWSNPASVTPPTVDTANVTWDSSNRRFVIPFLTTSGNGKMDVSTINASNLRLLMFDPIKKIIVGPSKKAGPNFSQTQAQGAMVPKDIIYDIAGNTVYVYVPDDFIAPMSGYNYAYVKVLISHNIRSADGLYLDGNGDGVATQDYNDALFLGYPSKYGVLVYNKLGALQSTSTPSPTPGPNQE